MHTGWLIIRLTKVNTFLLTLVGLTNLLEQVCRQFNLSMQHTSAEIADVDLTGTCRLL